MNVTLAFERCCVTKMRFTRVCMGTLQVCFKYLKFNVLWIKLTYLSCRILCCFTVFEAVLKRFQQVSAGGGVPLEKNTRLAGSELNHHTAKAKIFLRNGRSRFKSQSAEVWIPRFPVRRWLVHKSQCNGLKIAPLSAQICLSRCCIMRIANGEDTRFENRQISPDTANALWVIWNPAKSHERIQSICVIFDAVYPRTVLICILAIVLSHPDQVLFLLSGCGH